MKTNNIVTVLLVALSLWSCAPAIIPVSTKTETPLQTFTRVPPTSISTPTIWWTLATPLNLSYSNSGAIISIIDQLHPHLCIKNVENLLMLTPAPIEPAMQVTALTFTDITTLPEPDASYINERADNIDKSRTAFAGCQPRNCGKLYVKDNKIGKSYEINFGATTDRPLDWLQWINKDTVIVAQQGHVWIKIVAINIEKQQFEYYGMTPGCLVTATP